MVGNEVSENKKKTGSTNGIVKNVLNTIEYLENITILDISDRNITSFSEDLKLAPQIVSLNVSKNKLSEVPTAILNLENLKNLDLSFNCLVFFDDPPNFSNSIETLNLSNNNLEGPPLWVWVEKPKNLLKLNISGNRRLCHSFTNGYLDELIQYTTLVKEIDIHNCKLDNHIKLIATFCHAQVICLGSVDYENFSYNYLDHVPCSGLDQCCDIEVINLCNTGIYTVKSNIDIYKYLKEVNLTQNHIISLPNEFCNLECLEICLLSYNKILYLPDNIHKLSKLSVLSIDYNELCMLPETLCDIPSLKKLDLYNNQLYELIQIKNLEEVDIAQNYLDEPDSEEYTVKKEKLRLHCLNRLDGRKCEPTHSDKEYSDDETYDELNDTKQNGSPQPVVSNNHSSSPDNWDSEDWDSDDFWIPHNIKQTTPPCSPWLFFVKKKIEEGNFCPIDLHEISISEKVKYEKMYYPKITYESDGQFDDYSDDDS